MIGHVASWDRKLFEWVIRVARRTTPRRDLTRFFAEFFPYLVFVFFCLIPFFLSWSAFYVSLLAAVIARFIIVGIIRLFYKRARPSEGYRLFRPLGTWSFPSGHAVFFTTLAVSLFFSSPSAAFLFLVAAVVISISRVGAGVHWPSDAIAGMVIGLGFGLLF